LVIYSRLGEILKYKSGIYENHEFLELFTVDNPFYRNLLKNI